MFLFYFKETETGNHRWYFTDVAYIRSTSENPSKENHTLKNALPKIKRLENKHAFLCFKLKCTV